MCGGKLTVIGGGSAGCQAALYGAKYGLTVTLYEPDRIGGICLHTGCMPTKALLHGSGDWGDRVRQIRTQLSLLEQGMTQQLRRAGVTVCRQRAELTELSGEAPVILALGGPRNPLPQVPGKRVLDHRTVLELRELPRQLAIIGGGVSGLEFAQIFCALGVTVTVYEQEEMILPGFPEEFAERLLEICLQAGIEFVCGEPVALEALPQDTILWAAGSGPWQAEQLNKLAQAGIQAGPAGIRVDDAWRTSVPNVYAVGDCTDRTRTAFQATQAARSAVDGILGRAPVPAGIAPQVVCGWYDLVCMGADDGLTATVRMDRSGYALLRDRMDGAVQLTCDSSTGVLTGARLLYPGAAEAGSLLAAAIQAQMPVQTMAQTLFFHPAYAETIQEAAVELYDLYRKQADGARV